METRLANNSESSRLSTSWTSFLPSCPFFRLSLSLSLLFLPLFSLLFHAKLLSPGWLKGGEVQCTQCTCTTSQILIFWWTGDRPSVRTRRSTDRKTGCFVAFQAFSLERLNPFVLVDRVSYDAVSEISRSADKVTRFCEWNESFRTFSLGGGLWHLGNYT